MKMRGFRLPKLGTFFAPLTRPASPDPDVRAAVIAGLIEGATFDSNYGVLIVASCAIATFGLLENSAAVIIGAMIIAPMMPVIQAVAYGALEGSATVLRRALLTLGLGALIAVAFSAFVAKIVGLQDLGSEVLSRTRPNLLDLGIAVAAGAVGGFARVRPSIANTIAGTAIAVALMPPLCVVGIGLARGDASVRGGALLLFLTNLLGIALACMAVFVLAGYARRRAGAALAWTIGLTLLLLAPLALGLQTLVRESAVQSALRQALTTQTVTFRHAALVSSRFDWLTHPPTAYLLVRSAHTLSPHQVALLEAFAQRATGQQFRLVIDVTPVTEVTSAGYAGAPSPQP